MRNLLIKIHAYLGLFCVPYLLVFGISSLNFNHTIPGMGAGQGSVISWEKSASFPDSLSDATLAGVVNDSLGIMGWYIPWDSRRDSASFNYRTVHFGKQYDITLSFPEETVLVSATTESIGNIIKGLHFLGESIPRAPWWVNIWQFYQDLTVYGLLFWIISGLYFWAGKSYDRKWGLPVLFGSMILSLLFMFYLWLVG